MALIGLVLVTHGRLADEFITAAEHVVGPQSNIGAVCIGPDDDMEQRRSEILAMAKDVEDGKGVIILTDMFGGTPSNLANSLLGKEKLEVIAGINLPLMIKLIEVRDEAEFEDAVTAAREAGRKYINIASRLLAGETD